MLPVLLAVLMGAITGGVCLGLEALESALLGGNLHRRCQAHASSESFGCLRDRMRRVRRGQFSALHFPDRVNGLSIKCRFIFEPVSTNEAPNFVLDLLTDPRSIRFYEISSDYIHLSIDSHRSPR